MIPAPGSDFAEQMSRLREAYERLPASRFDETAIVLDYRHKLELLREVYARLPAPRQRSLTIPAIFRNSYNENFISDYLAYILHPTKNGVGIDPLASLFSEILGEELEASEDSIDILREYAIDEGRIDLLVMDGDSPVLVIENKIYAWERPNQTVNYHTALDRNYKDNACKYIFLTIDGHPADSKRFKSLSYPRLLEILKGIDYDWTADIRKSILWEDFLTHLKEYIVMESSDFKVSERTLLYLQNYTMIQNLSQSYKEDWPQLLQFLRTRVEEKMREVPPGNWVFSFEQDDYQQVGNNRWSIPNRLNVHFEFHLKPSCLKDGKFLLMVDVERGKVNLNRFRNLFGKRLPELQSEYDSKGIAYRSKLRDISIATKQYDFKTDFSNIADRFIFALEEFLFLVNPIDQTIQEFLADGK